MSTSLKKFGKSKWMGYRDQHLVELCRNKKIVHFGCTDWPYQFEQIQKGNLLHSKLIETTKEVIGVDIDSNGINELKKIYPNQHFITGDVSRKNNLVEEILTFKPDILLIPDVLEHIEDSRTFLSAIAVILRESQSIAIFTTPNSNSLKTYLPIFLNLDFTHPDHCLLHNEFTISHMLKDSEINISAINYLSRDISSKYGTLFQVMSFPIDLLSRIFPRLADTLIVVTEPTK